MNKLLNERQYEYFTVYTIPRDIHNTHIYYILTVVVSCKEIVYHAAILPKVFLKKILKVPILHWNSPVVPSIL